MHTYLYIYICLCSLLWSKDDDDDAGGINETIYFCAGILLIALRWIIVWLVVHHGLSAKAFMHPCACIFISDQVPVFFIIAIFRMDVYRSRSYNFISIVVHPSQHACSAASTNLSLINTLSLFFFFTFFSLSIYRIFTIIVSLSLTFLLKYYLERILFDFNSWMKMWIAHAFHAS